MSKFCIVYVRVFVNVGEVAEGEEKAIREEKGTRETVELEDCFVMNVLHAMLAICQFDSVLLSIILFSIKYIYYQFVIHLGEIHILRRTWISAEPFTSIPTSRARIRSVSYHCLVYVSSPHIPDLVKMTVASHLCPLAYWFHFLWIPLW